MTVKSVISFTLFFNIIISISFISNAHADLTRQVLKEIKQGRTIRAEIVSLKQIPVPEPSNLYEFVKDKQAAIELGKALFWDMQVGSDGIQACASCHFNAGADSRVKNQLSPGLLQSNQDASPNPDLNFDKGINFTLQAGDFPFHKKTDALDFTSLVISDTNDVNSSQGVHFAHFVDASTGNPVDTTTPASDPTGFQIQGINVRRIEPRQTPTVINAVFNHRQFWDGRASNIFNGVSVFGDSDPNAYVFVADPASNTIQPVRVSIDNSSLASQAVGPPLSNFEMSAAGRIWREVGDKFIKNSVGEDGEVPLRPLGKQLVHPQDSVLGYLSRGYQPGLNIDSYANMIQNAFVDKWWNGKNYIHVPKNSLATPSTVTFVSEADAASGGQDIYSHMEINFSLFFGIAVQLYEATLVSDDSPVDRFLDGDKDALTTSELVGFHLADVEARCLNCHGRGEFTFAAVSRVEEQGLTRIRRGDLIDEGFNNIGVRPTLEDLGVGGVDPFGNPLSFARQTHLGNFDNDKIPGSDGNPGTDVELNTDLGADGAFKIPTLRNVELTAPYFHNGGEATLEDVIDFYFRGGNFRTFDEFAEFPHPIIGFDGNRINPVEITGLGILQGTHKDSSAGLNTGAGLDDKDRDNIVAFLKALTDERVRLEKAPFDHPQLFVPNGHPGDEFSVTGDGFGNATDAFIEIKAVGANGINTPQPTYADNLGAGSGGGNKPPKPCKGKGCK